MSYSSDSQNIALHALGNAPQGCAVEVPASITVNGIAHAVMMLTPIHVEAFAIGFAFSEGIITHIKDLRDLVVSFNKQPLSAEQNSPQLDVLAIDLEISPRRFYYYRGQRPRSVTSGCGLCGHEAVESAVPPLTTLPKRPLPKAEYLSDLSELLNQAQGSLNAHDLDDRTQTTMFGEGLHVAMLRNPLGETVTCQQDIGRHNALDKVIGYALQQELCLTDYSVLISSRSSVELVQKAIRAGVSTLIHLGTPSSLAIQLARYYDLNLLRYSRQRQIQVFSPRSDSCAN